MTSDEKRALRDRLVRTRAAWPPSERARASAAAAAILAETSGWRSAATVALYAPMGAEVDTRPLSERAAAEGKRIAWPFLEPGALALRFGSCEVADLVGGPLGTREPPRLAAPVALAEIDLVVVPGVAFDARGRRLGRGRGHYDATLSLLPSRAERVGLAFELQLVPAVPAEAHDAPLDAVVTEQRLIRVPRALR